MADTRYVVTCTWRRGLRHRTLVESHATRPAALAALMAYAIAEDVPWDAVTLKTMDTPPAGKRLLAWGADLKEG